MSAHDRFTRPSSALHPQAEQASDIRIGKAVVPREAENSQVLAEVFTMTLGTETIQLLPLKNWNQLDIHKWRTRGILPGTPAGLEVTWEHVKVAGATVSPWDPDACAKLERAFSEWLELERQTLELAKQKNQSAAQALPPPDEDVVHFGIELGKAGQPRLKCLEGSELVKVAALNPAGLSALINQGLMRKPQTLKIGALHDWIELDGQMFRLDEAGARELEKTLNEKYVVAGNAGEAQDVTIYPNPASPTGFDIQFPATPNGVVETRKRHLDEQSVHLLQDPERCRVLRKGITARFSPPDLVFKRKLPAGGESYLDPGPESTVSVTGDAGQTKTIDLSQPISLLNLGVVELTAVFNHPAINRHARLAKMTQPQDDS